LIENKLIIQEARRQELKADDYIVQRELEDIKSKFQSQKEFEEGLTTQGLTTVSYLIYEILKEAKRLPSLLGTVGYKISKKTESSFNTTPGPMLLHSLFDRMRKSGSDYAVMEVSSHALKQDRVFGVNFKTAVLTNITGDHLDYHKTMKNYAASKRILFESLTKNGTAVLNRDDGYCDYFKKATKAKVIDYGIKNKADFRAVGIESDISGSSFVITTPRGNIKMKTALIGRHNIYNILAAASACFSEGVSPEIIKRAVRRFQAPPGRLESIDMGQPFRIFVDYAHTHDALEKVLSELRPLCKGKLVAVFGCGGDRDRTKRPKMGRIASKIADEIILTSDNPRSENPEAILDEIEAGIVKGFSGYERISDRFKAIRESLAVRGKYDVVIIAGKGHEDYQIIGKEIFPFSDKEAIEEILTKRHSKCLPR
ncbi:MAG: UDP-N-acetylmuramoyl-L-alanyl-D-glutamate--2,6-diaminopimelate ligase, partial [Candidatus Omnitrophota bacterium]